MKGKFVSFPGNIICKWEEEHILDQRHSVTHAWKCWILWCFKTSLTKLYCTFLLTVMPWWLCTFLLFFKEREGGEHHRGWGGVEGERENRKQAACPARSPSGGWSPNPEIMLWTEIRSQTLNWVSPWPQALWWCILLSDWISFLERAVFILCVKIWRPTNFIEGFYLKCLFHHFGASLVVA